MKRRDFITKTVVGALGAGLAGCSASKPRSIQLERKLPPFSFGDNYPRPKGGTMPMGELGTTGIKVSKFGFGSHLQPNLVPYVRERERMLRDAYELGVKVFDIYDKEFEIYQYEPTGRHLAPVINDVVISIAILPYDGRSLEEELERDLRVFGRDYLDMVRIHSYSTDEDYWWQWEELFKFKEQGKIRAVGVPIHHVEQLNPLIDTYPIDYVIFPYNFYHNVIWQGEVAQGDFDSLPVMLRKRGIGVVTMKALTGDYLVTPLKEVAEILKEDKEINFVQTALRYVINSGLNPDTTLTGMYYLSDVYENINAYYNPEMSDEELKLLRNVDKVAKVNANAWLPNHYKFLEEWAPKPVNDTESNIT